jgi:hypothetical protein
MVPFGWPHAVRCRLLRRVAVSAPYSAYRLLPRADRGWRAQAQFQHEATFVSYAHSRGLPLDGYLSEANIRLWGWLSTAEVRIRIDPRALAGFLRLGRYQTQFVTFASGGVMHIGRRMTVERMVLGVPGSCRPVDRPIYGYVSGSDEDGQILQYGPIVLRLRDHVSYRTTFTCCDSLDEAVNHLAYPGFVPMPMRRPDPLALSSRIDVLAARDFAEASPLPYRYIEAQIHGGVFAAPDVAEAVFTGGTGPDTGIERARPERNTMESDGRKSSMRVLAHSGDRYVLKIEDDLGRVFDLGRGMLFEPMSLTAILAKGHWVEFIGDPEPILSALTTAKHPAAEAETRQAELWRAAHESPLAS